MPFSPGAPPFPLLIREGLSGIWGTFSAGLFTSPARAYAQANNSVPGGFYSSSNTGQLGNVVAGTSAGFVLDPLNRPRGHQLGIQIAGLLAIMTWDLILVFAVFYVIKITIGLRVDTAAEEAGLDIRSARASAMSRGWKRPLRSLRPPPPSTHFSFQ